MLLFISFRISSDVLTHFVSPWSALIWDDTVVEAFIHSERGQLKNSKAIL